MGSRLLELTLVVLVGFVPPVPTQLGKGGVEGIGSGWLSVVVQHHDLDLVRGVRAQHVAGVVALGNQNAHVALEGKPDSIHAHVGFIAAGLGDGAGESRLQGGGWRFGEIQLCADRCLALRIQRARPDLLAIGGEGARRVFEDVFAVAIEAQGKRDQRGGHFRGKSSGGSSMEPLPEKASFQARAAQGVGVPLQLHIQAIGLDHLDGEGLGEMAIAHPCGGRPVAGGAFRIGGQPENLESRGVEGSGLLFRELATGVAQLEPDGVAGGNDVVLVLDKKCQEDAVAGTPDAALPEERPLHAAFGPVAAHFEVRGGQGRAGRNLQVADILAFGGLEEEWHVAGLGLELHEAVAGRGGLADGLSLEVVDHHIHSRQGLGRAQVRGGDVPISVHPGLGHQADVGGQQVPLARLSRRDFPEVAVRAGVGRLAFPAFAVFALASTFALAGPPVPTGRFPREVVVPVVQVRGLVEDFGGVGSVAAGIDRLVPLHFQMDPEKTPPVFLEEVGHIHSVARPLARSPSAVCEPHVLAPQKPPHATGFLVALEIVDLQKLPHVRCVDLEGFHGDLPQRGRFDGNDQFFRFGQDHSLTHEPHPGFLDLEGDVLFDVPAQLSTPLGGQAGVQFDGDGAGHDLGQKHIQPRALQLELQRGDPVDPDQGGEIGLWGERIGELQLDALVGAVDGFGEQQVEFPGSRDRQVVLLDSLLHADRFGVQLDVQRRASLGPAHVLDVEDMDLPRRVGLPGHLQIVLGLCGGKELGQREAVREIGGREDAFQGVQRGVRAFLGSETVPFQGVLLANDAELEQEIFDVVGNAAQAFGCEPPQEGGAGLKCVSGLEHEVSRGLPGGGAGNGWLEVELSIEFLAHLR